MAWRLLYFGHDHDNIIKPNRYVLLLPLFGLQLRTPRHGLTILPVSLAARQIRLRTVSTASHPPNTGHLLTHY